MKKQFKKLLSFAKTLGKHIWDHNKRKIISKGFNILKEGRSKATVKILNAA